VVGLLALGQPLSSRQIQASPPSLRSRSQMVLFNVKCPDNFFRLYWLSCLETRPELRFAQRTHQAGARRGVAFLTFIQALQIDHSSALTHAEF